MTLKFSIENQIIRRIDNETPVADSEGYLKAKFEFVTSEWDNIAKSANFIKDGNAYTVLLDATNEVLVPHEVIKEGVFEVSCFGGSLITNDKAKVRVKASGYIKGETPQPPTPDVYTQIASEYNRLNSIIKTDGDGKKVLTDNGSYKAVEASDAAIKSISINNEALSISEDKNVNIKTNNTLSLSNGELKVNVDAIEHPIHYIDLSSTPTYTSTLEPATYIVRTSGILRNNESLDIGFNVAVGVMIVVHSNGRATIFNGSVIIRLAQDTTREDITSRACYYDTDAEINSKLTDFVKNTDYATDTVGGVIKLGYGLVTASSGKAAGIVETKQGYSTWDNRLFISKGTLENLKTKSNTGITENADDISIPTNLAVKNYVDSIKPKQITFANGQTINAIDNAEYRANEDISTLNINFSTTAQGVWIAFKTVDTGNVTITLPQSAIYMNEEPTFENGKWYELDIKDGRVAWGVSV